MDLYFVKRLGLNSLIREAMNGGDPKDMSRLFYIYGVGKPVGKLFLDISFVSITKMEVGSMDGECLTETSTSIINGKKVPCTVAQHTGSMPHACKPQSLYAKNVIQTANTTVMMDCTHDNESPLSKRTAEDALPTGALVTLCWSAIGSNKGFDDLYPKTLDLVHDNRHYAVYKNPTENGIGLIKRILNHLHTEMTVGGYVEGHLHQENDVSPLLTLVAVET